MAIFRDAGTKPENTRVQWAGGGGGGGGNNATCEKLKIHASTA